MDPKAQKTIIPYDIEKLKGSIQKHEDNILAFEKAIKDERAFIVNENRMIAELEAKHIELNVNSNRPNS